MVLSHPILPGNMVLSHPGTCICVWEFNGFVGLYIAQLGSTFNDSGEHQHYVSAVKCITNHPHVPGAWSQEAHQYKEVRGRLRSQRTIQQPVDANTNHRVRSHPTSQEQLEEHEEQKARTYLCR
jgi:hypothetical protein